MSLLASIAIGKHYRFLSVCVVVGAALSGCGGSSSGDDSAASSVSSAVSSSSIIGSSLPSSSVVASSSVPAASSVSPSNSSAAVSSAIGRTDGGPSIFPYIDILAGDGHLSPLGGLYTAIPAENYRHPLPGRIEAEGAHSQTNFTHRATADTSGYVNLVAGANASAEFKVHVTQTGNYQLSLRIASAETHPELRVLLDNASLATLNNIQTGGEQVWQTLSANITLNAGNHSLQLEIPTANLAINWLEVSPL